MANKDEFESNSSIFDLLIGGSPLVAGAAIAGRGIKNSTLNANTTLSGPPPELQKAVAAKYMSVKQVNKILENLEQKILQELPKLPDELAGRHAEIMKMAFEQAVLAIEPNAEGIINSVPTFEKFDMTQTARALADIMTKPGGKFPIIHRQQLASVYLKNVPILAALASQTRAMPIFSQMTSLTGQAYSREAFTDLKQIGSQSLAETIKRIETSLGGAKASVSQRTRAGIPGKTLEVSFSGGKLGNKILNYNLARELPFGPFVRKGENLYHTPIHAIFDTEAMKITSTLKHEEWMMHRFESEVVAEIIKGRYRSQSAYDRAVTKFDQEFFKGAYEANSIFPVGALKYNALDKDLLVGESFYRGVEDPNLVRYMRSRANIVEIHAGRGGAASMDPLTPTMREELIRSGAVYPGKAKGLAKNQYLLKDPSQFYLSPVGAMPSRSPEQAMLHSPVGFSATSRARLKGDTYQKSKAWTFNEALRGSGLNPGDVPVLRMARLDEGIWRTKAEALGLHEGITFIHEKNRRFFERSETSTIKVSSRGLYGKGGEQASGIWALLAQAERPAGTEGFYRFKNRTWLQAGMGLGVSPSGEVITAPGRTEVLEAIQRGDELSLTVRTTRAAADFEKLFGASGKGMARFVGEEEWQAKVVRQLGVKDDVMAVTLADAKKDRHLFHQQMFTELQDILNKMFYTSGKRVRDKLRPWNENPLEQVRNLTAPGGIYRTAEEIEREAFKFAYQTLTTKDSDARVMSRQMGQIFGGLTELVPQRAGEEYHMTLGNWAGIYVRPSVAKEILKGRGIGHMWAMAGESMTERNIMGSIEPRLLELMRGPAWRGISDELTADILGRVAYANPGLVSSIDPLAKSALSLAGRGEPGPGESVMKLSELADRHFRPNDPDYLFNRPGGTWIDTEIESAGKLFIPSGSDVKALEAFKQASGQVNPGDLARTYQGILEDLMSWQRGRTQDAYALENIMGEARANILGEYTGLFADKGGLARTKVPGTRYMVGVGADWAELDIGEISRSQAVQMLDEMAESGVGLTDAERTAFLETKGALLPGWVARQPAVSLSHLTPMRWRINDDLAEGSVRLPQRRYAMELAGIDGVQQILRGAPVQMFGDYDADNYLVGLASGKVKEHLERYGSRIGAELEQEGLRVQLLKAASRAPSGEALSREEILAGEVGKRQVSAEFVGHVSNAASRIREAAIFSNLPEQEIRDIAESTAMIEELAINPKFLPNKNAAIETRKYIEKFLGAVDRRSGADVVDMLREAISRGSGKELGEAMLSGGLLDVTQTDELSGASSSLKIQAFNSEKMAANISNLLETSTNQEVGYGMTRANIRDVMARARRTLTPGQLETIMQNPQGIFKSMIATVGPGAAESSRGMAALNRAIANAKNIIKKVEVKPLLAGLGGAALLAGLMGGSEIKPGGGSKGPISGGADSPIGEPSIPQMAPNKSSMTPNAYRTNVTVSGTSNTAIDKTSLTSRLKRSLLGERVNLHVTDSRRKYRRDDIDY